MKRPFTAVHVRPEELAVWQAAGRLLVTKVITKGHELLVLGIYGYPPGHAMAHTNDAFFGAVMSCLGSRHLWALLLGTLMLQPVLVRLSLSLSLFRLSSDATTTKGRASYLSKGSAIDHILVNSALMRLGPTATTRYDLSLADHFAVQASFHLYEEDIMCWKLPAIPDLPSEPIRLPYFSPGATSFMQWSDRARRWIIEATDVHVEQKHRITTTMLEP